jgi:peptide deformylase
VAHASAMSATSSATPLLPVLPAGRVLPVVRAPAHVLSEPAPEVDPADPAIVQLAADLLATQNVSPGCVGLAAPQVGVAARLFSLDVTGHPKARTVHGPVVLANARIAEATRWERGREGCMSVPDLTGDVKRATRLTVVGRVPGTGDELVLTTDAFEARAYQHEIDHCAGLLFLDRVAGAHALHQRKTYL